MSYLNEYSRFRFFRVSLFAALAALSGYSIHAGAEVEANVLAVQPGETIPLTVVPDGIFLRVPNDPDDTIWERVPEYQVQLTPAPPVHPSIALRAGDSALQSPLALYFNVISDRDRLYIRLRWTDDTANVATRTNQFRDGAAVQFALDGGENTSYLMGTPDMPVNIWYWKSDNDSAQNLGAGGFGSTTILPEQTVSADSQFRQSRLTENNEWVVVMSRPLEADGDYTVSLDPKNLQPLAFAVWQGAGKQRDGNKRITQGWIKLDMSSLAGS